MLRLSRIGILLIATWVAWEIPAWGQDSVAQMGEQRLADAKIFLQDSEWDAALVAVEESTWYFPEGDEHLDEVRSVRNQANAGKARARADVAMDRGDFSTAVRKYEESLRLHSDSATRTKLQQARDALASAEPDVPDQPEPSTPDEPATPAEPPTQQEPETPAEPITDADGAVDGATPAEPTTAEPATPVAETPTPPDPGDGDGLASVEPRGSDTATGGGGDGRRAGKTPWGWLLALLAVVALGVVGTRTPVLTSVAGTLRSAGSHQSALSLYGVIQRRGGADTAVRHAQVDCLLALERFDDEARRTYDRAIGEDLPAETTVRLAKVYAQRGITGDDATRLYRLAAEHDDDPAILEALEQRMPADDAVSRLAVAQRLIAQGRSTPDRLLLVAEQYEGGEPDEDFRRVLPEALALVDGDETLRQRRADLVDRLLPAYQEFEIKGEDAIVLRQAYLESVERHESRPGAGPRMVGSRARRARVILADLSRMLWESEQGERLFQIHLSLLSRYRGEPFLLDGLLQVAADIEAHDRGLAAIDDLYDGDRSRTDAALTVQVATAFMLAATRNLRARADQVGTDSSEFPGLTLLSRAWGHLATLAPAEGHRPDVREKLDLFGELYQSNDIHLLPLDADLADLLWNVGNYPGAVSLFLWNCGLEPHPVDGGLLVVPTDQRPPFSELFPDEMSTLVEVIGDRAIHREDVDKLAFRARSGVMNPYLAFLVGVAPFADEVHAAAAAQGPPVILLDWSEIHAALSGGHPRPTLRRVIADRSPYPLARLVPPVELEDLFVFGRGPASGQLRSRLIGLDPARVQVVSGLPGVGKSTLLHSALRTPDTPPVGFLEPTPDPELYVPMAWLDLMASLFESARRKGQVTPVSAFPERELAIAPDADAAAFEAGFQHLRARLDGPTGAGRPVLVIDPVEALFPLEDPLAEDAHRADGAGAMLEALVNLAERGEASLVLVTRDVGGTSGRAIAGHPLPLPDSTDELVVGLLGAESCRTAFDRLLHDLGATVGNDSLEFFADAAGGHPLVMWTLMDEIARWCSPGAEALDLHRAGSILDRVMQQTPFQRFAHRLFASLDPGAREVLRALSAADDGVLDAAAIAEALSANGDAAATESVLDALTRTTLVTPRQSEGYQLRIGLLRRYFAELPPFP